MKGSNNRSFPLMEKIENKQKLTYDEFIEIVNFGLEMQFLYKNRKFGVTHFNGYEFYEWEKVDGYQSYKTIDEFAQKFKNWRNPC